MMLDPDPLYVEEEPEFWSRVDKSGECWTWSGSRFRNGYGQVRLLGERYAHRASWVQANGPIPRGMCILHRCDNPPCVRPDHLWLGTHLDNARDKMRKGRWRGGAHLKPRCGRGHEMIGENVGMRLDGRRYCHTCSRLWADWQRGAGPRPT